MFRRPASASLRAMRRAGFVAVAILAAWVPTAHAQFFPTDPATPIVTENFETDELGNNWSASNWEAFDVTTDATPFVGGSNTTIDQVSANSYFNRYVIDQTSTMTNPTILVSKTSIPGSGSYVPDQWTNFVFEFDMVPGVNSSQGVAWSQLDTDDDDVPNQGYFFYIENVPTRNDAINLGARAKWRFIRREAGVDIEMGDNSIEFDPSDPDLLTMYVDWAYRVRVEWFCGNLRIRAYRIQYESPSCTTGCAYGCGAGCSIANTSACWCQITSWSDVTPLAPGMTGLLGRSTDADPPANVWDNVSIAYWGTRCEAVCDSWTPFQEDWNDDGSTTEDSRDNLRFKFLYDAALIEYAQNPTAAPTEIDVAVDGSKPVSCQGWERRVNLPGPLEASGTNLDALNAYLRPMADSVEWYDDGSTTFWQRDFNNDDTSPDFNPNPLIPLGQTPIAASLMDAYTHWYVGNRTNGGPYELDPLSDCRLWYVVLITDGEESCACDPQPTPGLPPEDWPCLTDPTRACDPGEAAELFAAPPNGLDPVPVYVVGFSEGVSASSPIECVASITDGQFYSASDASQLSGVLYDVFNQMEERDRSFIGFGVSQPAATATTLGSTATLLVYPWFVPRNGETIWDGSLFAFTVDEDNPSLPVSGGALDFTAANWNAKTALVDRLAETSPSRNIYWGSDPSDWDRVPVVGTVADATLATEFRALIDPGFAVSDTQLKEIENYITYLYDDGSLTPAPQINPRPKKATSGSAHELGDIYHSRPVVVSPPYDTAYLDDYGFVPDGESGAHDYRLFVERHAKRRRVVLAGANDGMLHGFDGGFFNRDTTNYPGEHDGGTGRELFAWIPRAVMPNVYNMVYAAEHQYMVDGHITTGDVWIDPDPYPSPSESDREWRTVALSTMRRGGRGIVALDVTQPDTLTGTDFVPTDTDDPGCLNFNGSTPASCVDEYPKLLWEFSDTADTDGNGNGDLGWTWSTPAIARLAIYNSTTPAEPKDMYVAFFGGGWDFDLGNTGNFFYGVDIETGQTVVKVNLGASVPAPPAVVDSDNDAFDDRVYIATSDGKIYRLQYPAPTDSASTGATAAFSSYPTPPLPIFDFSADSAGPEFFHKPVVVPIGLDAGGYTFALALGTGDRANLGDLDGVYNRFYFLVDGNQTSPVGSSALSGLNYSAIDQATLPSGCGDVLNFSDGNYGWYVDLREHEKVNNEAVVVAGNVFFTGFVPINASSGGGGGGGGGGGTAPTCQAAGSGFFYRLWYECGVTGPDGFVDDFNDIPVDLQLRPEPGGGGFIVEVFGTSPDGPEGTGPTTSVTIPYTVTHETTNWMQE
jgi:hypothetical protein